MNNVYYTSNGFLNYNYSLKKSIKKHGLVEILEHNVLSCITNLLN